MFARCLPFPRAILCGLVFGGIGLANVAPAQADNPVQKLEKKLDKAKRKSRRFLRKAGKAGILVLEGVAEVGGVVAVEILQTEIDCDATGETKNQPSQSNGKSSSSHPSTGQAAVPAAPPAKNTHSPKR
jgi:hypothetical protein